MEPPHLEEDDGEEEGEDDTQTWRQPIHPIDEVDGISDPHKPDDREGIIKCITPDIIREDNDCYPEYDGDNGGSDLGKQF